MVKNTTGGNKHKKGKNKAPVKVEQTKATLIHAEEYKDKGILEMYAIIKKREGQKRLLVQCADGVERSCCIPGKMYKKYWCNIGDIILCNIETIGNNKLCYLMHRYSPEHISILRQERPDPLAFTDKEKMGSGDAVDSEEEEEEDVMPVKTQKSVYDPISSDDSSDDDKVYKKGKTKIAMGNEDDSDSDDDSEDEFNSNVEELQKLQTMQPKMTDNKPKANKKPYREDLDEEIFML
jgi:initiation factor 1A